MHQNTDKSIEKFSLGIPAYLETLHKLCYWCAKEFFRRKNCLFWSVKCLNLLNIFQNKKETKANVNDLDVPWWKNTLSRLSVSKENWYTLRSLLTDISWIILSLTKTRPVFKTTMWVHGWLHGSYFKWLLGINM